MTFNDHEGSTKSYLHTRKHQLPVVEADFVPSDFVPPAEEITATVSDRGVTHVALHDGSTVNLRRVAPDYDPTNREAVWSYLYERQRAGEIPVGLLYVDEHGVEMHAGNSTVKTPLSAVPYEELCPGSAALAELMEEYR